MEPHTYPLRPAVAAPGSARSRAVHGRGAAVAGLVVTVCLSIVPPAAAHKAHRAPAGDTAAAVAADTARAVGAGAARTGAPAETRAEPPAVARYVMPPFMEAALEHPHNKLVHFPVALALAAALLLLIGRRRPELDIAGRWLVWLAALGGVAAYFSGRLQEEAFKGEPKEWVVELHEKLGLASAIALAAWALLTLWKPGRRYAWLWGLAVTALVLIAGFLGGIVAHGE